MMQAGSQTTWVSGAAVTEEKDEITRREWTIYPILHTMLSARKKGLAAHV